MLIKNKMPHINRQNTKNNKCKITQKWDKMRKYVKLAVYC